MSIPCLKRNVFHCLLSNQETSLLIIWGITELNLLQVISFSKILWSLKNWERGQRKAYLREMKWKYQHEHKCFRKIQDTIMHVLRTEWFIWERMVRMTTGNPSQNARSVRDFTDHLTQAQRDQMSCPIKWHKRTQQDALTDAQ